MKNRRILCVISVIICLVCISVIGIRGKQNLGESSLKGTAVNEISTYETQDESKVSNDTNKSETYSSKPVGYKYEEGYDYENIKTYDNNFHDEDSASAYDEVRFADKNTVDILRKIYEEIDFSSEFSTGDSELYERAKSIYCKLINNKRTFIDKETGKEYYVKEYGNIKSDCEIEGKYNPEMYDYSCFDIDGNGVPELLIQNLGITRYVFSYLPDRDQIVKWDDFLATTWYYLHGNNAIGWAREGEDFVFYKFNDAGEETLRVSFFQKTHFNQRLHQPETIYMVGLPKYSDEAKQIVMTNELQEQGYYYEGNNVYLFRVTKEHYEELTGKYYKAKAEAEKNLAKVTYEYEELIQKWKVQEKN